MRNQIMCVAVLLAAVLPSSALAEWTTPVPVTSGINTQYNEMTPYLSYDGLSLYFASNSTGDYSIYEAKRTQPSGAFTSVSQVYSAGPEVLRPWVSPDNLRMYYYTESGGWRIEMTQRSSVNDPWSLGSAVPGLPGSSVYGPSLTSDELTIVFNNPSVGNWDMYIATRPDKNSEFGNIRSLSELNTASFSECNPFLSPDGLSLYFNANPTGQNYLYEATRQSLNDQFGAPQLLPINYTNIYGGGWPAISSDGKALYFGAGPSSDIYVSYLLAKQVTVDIRPGACPNPFNPKSRGVFKAAILGSEDFDVNTIDIASIRLAGVAPVRSSFEDVSAPASDTNDCSCSAGGPDGFVDLVLTFETQEAADSLAGKLGDLNKGDIITVPLTGSLLNQTLIEGQDCVTIVGNQDDNGKRVGQQK